MPVLLKISILTVGFSGIYLSCKQKWPVPNTLIGIVIGIVVWIFSYKGLQLYIVNFIKLSFLDSKKNLLVEDKAGILPKTL